MNAYWHLTPEAIESVGDCGPLKSTGSFLKEPASTQLLQMALWEDCLVVQHLRCFGGKRMDKVLCEICPLQNVTLFFFFKSGTNKINLQAQLGS